MDEGELCGEGHLSEPECVRWRLSNGSRGKRAEGDGWARAYSSFSAGLVLARVRMVNTVDVVRVVYDLHRSLRIAWGDD